MSRVLQKTISISLLVSMLVTTGCSAFRGHSQAVNINCSEPGAMVTVNGQRYNTPCQVRMKRNRDVSIQCYKEGHIPYQRTIGHHLNGTGALDAAGTLLIIVPCVGLFCPGAWSLDETDVFITLYDDDE